VLHFMYVTCLVAASFGFTFPSSGKTSLIWIGKFMHMMFCWVGFVFVVPHPARLWYDVFLSWMLDCIVAWWLLFILCFLVAGAWCWLPTISSVEVYLYSLTVSSWQGTGWTLPFLWNLIGTSFFLLVLVLALSHRQHWSCMIVAVCFDSVITVIILVGLRLVMGCLLLGLDSILYFVWCLNLRTWYCYIC
jgi:hypothetical protein